MTVVFAIAIYFIIWWVTLFTVLPFGVRTQGEAGEVVPGTPSSAPARTPMKRVFAINTVVAGIVFIIVWMILESGWISPEMFKIPDNSPV